MTNRDDALRKELGWTAPEEATSEPVPEQARPVAPPTVAVPSPAPPRPGGWGQPRPTTWPPHVRPPGPPQQHGGTPWPARPPAGPEGYPAAPQPGSYADRIRVDELVPTRKPAPGRGWRLAVYKATFGMVNLGPSPEERRLAQLEATIRGPLRGHFKVGVMGKGGAGKTTVSACIGSVLAELRQDDRVVAVDADTAFGKLGSRVDPKAQGSFWELAGDQHLATFADVRNRVGSNSAGLFVLAGEATGCSIRRSTARPRPASIATSASPSSTAARRWTPPSHRRCYGTSTPSSWCPRRGWTALPRPGRRWTGWQPGA